MPLDDDGIRLHNDLLAGDPTATARIAQTYLPRLVNSLQRQFHNLPDPFLVEDAANRALLYYFRKPARYNPDRSTLFSFLRLVARSRLLHLLDSEKRHHPDNTVSLDVVEL